MPIHEYECENCGHQFEKLTFVTDKDDITCPQCGGENVRRLLSACGFIGVGKSGNSCSPAASKGFS